jgi:hypothetical protein
MRQRVGVLVGSRSDESRRAFVPKRASFSPESAKRVSLAIALLAGFCTASAEAALPANRWSQPIVVDTPNAEGRLLQAAFQTLSHRKVALPITVQALGDLNRYVDGRTGQGKSAIISVGMIVDVLVAANAARWSPEDASRALLQMQAAMDASRPPSVESLHGIIARIQPGRTVDEVLRGEAF